MKRIANRQGVKSQSYKIKRSVKSTADFICNIVAS